MPLQAFESSAGQSFIATPLQSRGGATAGVTIIAASDGQQVRVWDGAVSWSTLTAGQVASLDHLLQYGGQLHAGPAVNNAGVHRWGGAAWEVISGPDTAWGTVNAMVAVGAGVSGLPLAGERIGLIAHNGIAPSRHWVWDGSAWGEIGAAGLPSNFVGKALAVRAGALWMRGATSVQQVYRWTGAAWELQPSPSQSGGLDYALGVAGGDLYAGGAGVGGRHVSRWTGSAWDDLEPLGASEIISFGDRADLLLAGGRPASGNQTWVHELHGSTWSTIGGVFHSATRAVQIAAILAVGATDEIFAGGMFDTVGGVEIHRVARWSPADAAWLSTGLAAGSSSIGSIAPFTQ